MEIISKESGATKCDNSESLKDREALPSGMAGKENSIQYTDLIPCCTVHTSERTSQPEDDSSPPQNTELCSDSPLL